MTVSKVFDPLYVFFDSRGESAPVAAPDGLTEACRVYAADRYPDRMVVVMPLHPRDYAGGWTVYEVYPDRVGLRVAHLYYRISQLSQKTA